MKNSDTALSGRERTASAGRLLPLALAVVTFLAFLPALNCGFITWDDGSNFLWNYRYRGLGHDQLRWMFTTFHLGPYQPLSWMTLGLDYVLWGMKPAGYHLTSVLLHSLAAALFFALSLRLLRLGFGDAADEGNLRWGAAFAALVFAVHPLRVESVAWVTERRDVLSGVLYLASAIWYLRAAGAGPGPARTRPFAFSLFFFAAALLSKATGVGFAFVLLALDLYPLKRLPPSPARWFENEYRPVLLEKLPFLGLGLAAGIIGLVGQRYAHTLPSLEAFGLAQRIVQTLFTPAFYLWKTVLPIGLLPVYRPSAPFDLFALPFVLGGAATIFLAALLLAVRGRLPGLVSAAAAYLVFLAPVIGLMKMGYVVAADRYTYLACMSWAVVAGALLVRLQAEPGRYRAAVRAAALVLAAVLACLTWRQTGHWRDSETLWRYMLAAKPDSDLAHNNLGVALQQAGRDDEALEEFWEAYSLNPHYPDANYNIWHMLCKKGRRDLAWPFLEESLRGKPYQANAYIDIGNILAGEGRDAEALGYYHKALGFQPDSNVALANLGNALVRLGRYAEAERAYRDALRLNPAQAEAYQGLGYGLLRQGRPAEAVPYFRRALRLRPDMVQARNNLIRAEKALSGKPLPD